MKKIMITLGVLLAGSTAFTQGAYATFGLGYAGSTAGEKIGETTVYKAGKKTTTSINGTFGKGIPVNLGVGFMVSEHIGVELGFTYLMGSEITISETTSDAALGLVSDITKTKGSSVRVSPVLVLSTGGEGLSLYSKLGLIVPVGGKTTYVKETTLDGGPTDILIKEEGESKGSFSMGYTASLGASMPIAGNISVFGELQMLNLRIKGNTKTVTSYEVAGVDKLSTLPKSVTHTEYVDEIGPDDNTDPTKATKELNSASNYSTLGINVGVKMKF